MTKLRGKEAIKNSLQGSGFDSVGEVSLDKVDGVFEAMVRLYKQEQISLRQLSEACEEFFQVTHDWFKLVNRCRHGSLIFKLADVYAYFYFGKGDHTFVQWVREEVEGLEVENREGKLGG